MLTDNEKSKIDIDTYLKIFQAGAILLGFWVTYNEYKSQNAERKISELAQREQTAKEFRKNFYQKQMDYYSEATEATATLATEDISSDDYIKARKIFYRLYWGKLSIVENREVEAEMVKFKELLEVYEEKKDEASKDKLKNASLRLAHAASSYVINVWIDSTERKDYNR